MRESERVRERESERERVREREIEREREEGERGPGQDHADILSLSCGNHTRLLIAVLS